MRLQQCGCQCRRQGERVECRNHGRDCDRQCKLPIELAGQTGYECDRHKHRAQHQRNRNDWAADFFHCLYGGVARRQAGLDVAFDILDHHNRIVDNDTDRQYQPEQRQRIDRKTEQQQYRKRANDRNRHCNQWNDRSTPCLQENDYDQHHQRNRFEQCGDDSANRFAHELGRVIHDAIVDTFREIVLQLFHLRTHIGRQLQCIRLRRFKDGDCGGGLVVQQRAQCIVAGTKLNPRHVFQ